MVKQLLVLCVLLAVGRALALPAPVLAPGELISFSNHNDGLGEYSFSYQTSDGVSRTESAQLVQPGEAGEPGREVLVVSGQYSYIAPDGVTYTYNYVADHNGYRVSRVQ